MNAPPSPPLFPSYFKPDLLVLPGPRGVELTRPGGVVQEVWSLSWRQNVQVVVMHNEGLVVWYNSDEHVQEELKITDWLIDRVDANWWKVIQEWKPSVAGGGGPDTHVVLELRTPVVGGAAGGDYKVWCILLPTGMEQVATTALELYKIQGGKRREKYDLTCTLNNLLPLFDQGSLISLHLRDAYCTRTTPSRESMCHGEVTMHGLVHVEPGERLCNTSPVLHQYKFKEDDDETRMMKMTPSLFKSWRLQGAFLSRASLRPNHPPDSESEVGGFVREPTLTMDPVSLRTELHFRSTQDLTTTTTTTAFVLIHPDWTEGIEGLQLVDQVPRTFFPEWDNDARHNLELKTSLSLVLVDGLHVLLDFWNVEDLASFLSILGSSSSKFTNNVSQVTANLAQMSIHHHHHHSQ